MLTTCAVTACIQHVGHACLTVCVTLMRVAALQVAWVRRRGVGRSLPRAHLQADLDIVTLPGSTPAETLLADAEAIRIVSEARALPSCVPHSENLSSSAPVDGTRRTCCAS